MNHQEENRGGTGARLMGRGVGRGGWSRGLHAATQHSVVALGRYSGHKRVREDAV